MVENVIQINNGMSINVGASVKNKKKHFVKKVISGILQHVFARMVNIQQVIIDDLVILCDEIIEIRKTVPTNFNEKR